MLEGASEGERRVCERVSDRVMRGCVEVPVGETLMIETFFFNRVC